MKQCDCRRKSYFHLKGAHNCKYNTMKIKKKQYRWAVYVENSATKEWEVMKLIVDQKKQYRGLAVYRTRHDAMFTEQMAHALSGGAITTRIAIYHPIPRECREDINREII